LFINDLGLIDLNVISFAEGKPVNKILYKDMDSNAPSVTLALITDLQLVIKQCLHFSFTEKQFRKILTIKKGKVNCLTFN